MWIPFDGLRRRGALASESRATLSAHTPVAFTMTLARSVTARLAARSFDLYAVRVVAESCDGARRRVVSHSRAHCRRRFDHFDHEARVVRQAIIIKKSSAKPIRVERGGELQRLAGAEPSVAPYVAAAREEVVKRKPQSKLQLIVSQRGL